MPDYSKKVHCSDCGNLFPRSQTKLLSFGKNVLRLCDADYEVKAKAAEKLAAQAAEKAEALVKQAAENIANARGKER
jgi:hypothetical protein